LSPVKKEVIAMPVQSVLEFIKTDLKRSKWSL